MNSSIKVRSSLLILIPILLITLSCNLLSSPTLEPTIEPTSEPAETDIVLASNSDVQIEYVYTTNLITILYPLYGKNLDNFVDITIHNQGVEAAKIIVQTEIIGYTTQSSDTIDLDAGEDFEFSQNPQLIPEKIDQLNSAKPAQFHIRVTALDGSDEKLLLDETKEVSVYARRDFPWAIPGFTDEEVFELMAAMVTPNDPAVEELLRKAAEYTDSGIMWNGYGDEPNDGNGGVYERLEAIWAAEEEDYDLTYISTWVSFAPGSVQRIRLPAEVLEQKSGNCIETSLVYASAAEAMGLEAAIIGVPGHAYVAIRTDQENADYYFIETTLIGRASFAEAINRGSEEFEEALPHLEAKESGYGWVTINEAREKGILPLPWH